MWTPPPRVCLLGGVQTCTLAAWVAGSANQGRMEFRGVAVPVRGGGAGLMGRQGFLRRHREKNAIILGQSNCVLPVTALVYACGLGMILY